MKEQLRQTIGNVLNRNQGRIGRVMGEVALRGFRKEVAGTENLAIAKKHIENGGSVLFIADHFSGLDFAIDIELMQRITSLDKIGGVMSMRHLDPNASPIGRIEPWLAEAWEKGSGITVISMPQKGDLREYRKKGLSVRDVIDKAFANIKDFLGKPGRALLFIPEGTRAKDGKLKEGVDATERVLKETADQNVLIVPISTVQEKLIPVLSDTLTVVGKPFTYQELLEEQKENPDLTITQLAMLRIADNLPDNHVDESYHQIFAAHPSLRKHPEFSQIDRFRYVLPKIPNFRRKHP
jgi:1-acyl-sn-glycerol-3-phosphate acyltransferase